MPSLLFTVAEQLGNYMPSKIKTFCINGCKNKADKGANVCNGCRAVKDVESSENQKIYNKRRGSASSRGYNHQWQKVARLVRASEPICRMCKKNVAEMVDHINPLKKGGDRLALDNLQPLCNRCHRVKTIRDGTIAEGAD